MTHPRPPCSSVPAGGWLMLALAGTLVAGCANAPHLTRSQEATRAACRKEVDRVYAAQNRDELSRRSEVDTPFAAGYLSGVTSRGLSSEYRRDTLQQDCLNASAGPDQGVLPASPGVGPAFTPAKP